MTSSPVVSTKEDSPTAIFLSRASMEMNSLEAILRNVKVAMGDLEAAEKRILGLRDLRRIEEANARLAKQELTDLQHLVKKIAPAIGKLKDLEATYISSETHPADPEKVEVQNLFGVVAAADEGYQKVVTFLSRYL
ncbi:uncharacterized protein H6S33_012234 [Morchella sextelata]|uniref:uncharacterized protein n=1 Tax=Morchella sextelata TaxID=1174677 RepID=UPI001D0595CC|nr:uncharacterized protein H6S33_012234 [Morchella sextelata]KAH0610707.1 hypothetical protein H6S33_012234 [Morchella sextelata]